MGIASFNCCYSGLAFLVFARLHISTQAQGKANTMTYLESAQGIKISKARAYKEFETHGVTCDWIEFVLWAGDRESYWAEDVLGWLGY